MIYLLTGVPGAGKSLMQVKWIKQWLDEGRPVFSNIAGLKIEGVEEPPDDWRDTPEGSVVMYDEAQKWFRAPGRAGITDREDILAMEEHRHTAHDIVLATQFPTFIHHHVRHLVGRHVHLERHGKKRATVFDWDQSQDVRDSQARQTADKYVWKYPKELFALYESATAHTHQFKVPRKLLFLGLVICVILAGAGYAFASLDYASAGEESQPSSTEPEGSAENEKVREPRQTVRRDRGGTYQLVGGRPESLDGAELTDAWRIVGRVEGGSRSIYMLKSRNGDHQKVPAQGWEPLEYRNGLLKVRAPAGVMLVSWLTDVQNGVQNGADTADSRRLY